MKLPKAITHSARLADADEAIAQFCDEVAGLGDKLGNVLVQLPPSLKFEAAVAEKFFAALRRWTQALVACAPRHLSWFGPDVDQLWQIYLTPGLPQIPHGVRMRPRSVERAYRAIGVGTDRLACTAANTGMQP